MNNILPFEKKFYERKRTSKEAENEFLDLNDVVDKIGVGITASDKKGHFEIFNKKMEEITGYTIEEANNQEDFNSLIYPDSEKRLKALKQLNELKKTGNQEIETAIQAKNGSIKILLVSTSLIKFKEQVVYLSTYRDVTARKRSEEKLQASEIRFRRLFDTAQDGILILDENTGQIAEVNLYLIDLLGYSREELLGKQLWEIGAFKDIEASKRIFQELQTKGYVRYEDLPLRSKDGRLMQVEFVSNVYIANNKKVIQCNIRNITDRKKLEKAREQLSLRDSRTGLLNHRCLKEVLEKEFSQSERQSNPFSVIMIDIDFFKSINDVYGHIFGDLILKQFARLLTKTVRAGDIVIRYGGEEFIIVSGNTHSASAQILAQRILSKTNLCDFGNEAHSIKLKISLGISSYPENPVLRGMDLIVLADQILNKAKELGGNQVCTSLDMKRADKTKAENSDVELLKEKINKMARRANQSSVEAIFAFARKIGTKDHYTAKDVERSVQYASAVAQELNLPLDKIEHIKQASILHDLGKIGINEKILHKKSKLTKSEFEEIKKHSQISVDIMRPIQSLRPVMPLILHHHERWDGKGYPYGLKKKNIPLGSRIVAVVDAYQAMVSDRPYRKAYSKESAMKIIKRGSGSLFDPAIVNLFFKIVHPVD